MPSQNPVQKSSTFDHIFSGWSVWLEPCSEQVATQEMNREINDLSLKCGGPEKGVHPVPLHCTVLYNFKPPSIHDFKRQQLQNEEEYAMFLLRKCLEAYNTKRGMRESENSEDSSDINTRTDLLVPKSFYFFPYPKEADEGRGFGCVIPLIILENTKEIDFLHSAAKMVFPPDERHGSEESNTQDQKRIEENEETKREAKQGIFRPHMALVYAPEIRHDWLEIRTKELEENNLHWLETPLHAKYLSVWSTEGHMKDWRLVSRIKL